MKRIAIVLLVLGLSACVSHNVYFPGAAVEKAADRIIAEVWPLADKAKEKK